MIGHVMGMPIEETVIQLAPAGAATATLIALAGRTGLDRLLARLRRR
jgi:hypothetical protein